ncbi:26S proteasome regulatory subunit RPN9 [Vanrija pseudolonga]|uniref:26S proteasome regulatory subunit RPN9 n=1 Tax=Vanrija pseudolonga TaxID=143232 RepID=A0AAF1BHP5_9TREE|nr:26S proteasome regulatory subunit RPN9 [Vanrija pseudolonga]
MDVDQPSSSTTPLVFLEKAEAAAPAALQPSWTKIRTTYEKKLWHNLTVSLVEFVFLPGSGPYQIELFHKFITTIESKINALKLVEIARRVGREYSEPDLTLKFLQSVHSRLASPYPVAATDDTPAVPAPPPPATEAVALSLSSIAYAQLLLGDLAGCKKSLDECEKLLSEQDTVAPVVNAGYYAVAGDYYKVKADYGPYYKNALLYLSSVDVDRELTPEDRKARAHDLCIAALLGETIYNFGELLQHPILQTLDGTEYGWIKDLISAFNAGAIGKFDSLTNHFASEPILAESVPFLRQKICLMALIQAAFERPRDGSTRLMTFEQIGEATRLPVQEVEHLIMKALSLGLIRGSLDQVSSTVDITWVQPRVLEGSQLDTLAEQFGHWTDAVGETANGVQGLEHGVVANGLVPAALA